MDQGPSVVPSRGWRRHPACRDLQRNLVFALLLALTACRARPEFENPPPCVPLVGPGEVRGQAIWINRRALTAAHVLTYGGAEFPPARVVLNGDPTPIVLYQSGNPGVLPP